MSDPETALREAAQAVVDLSDDLARWDELNRYVVNSERDYLAGNLSAAWDRLRAALAAREPEPRMVRVPDLGDVELRAGSSPDTSAREPEPLDVER